MGKLKNFKKGDKVEIISCKARNGGDAYKSFQGTIGDIEFKDVFRTGKGSMILNLLNGGSFIATGIKNRLKMKLIQ